MFADIEIAHTIDHNYDINDKFAESGGQDIYLMRWYQVFAI